MTDVWPGFVSIWQLGSGHASECHCVTCGVESQTASSLSSLSVYCWDLLHLFHVMKTEEVFLQRTALPLLANPGFWTFGTLRTFFFLNTALCKHLASVTPPLEWITVRQVKGGDFFIFRLIGACSRSRQQNEASFLDCNGSVHCSKSKFHVNM